MLSAPYQNIYPLIEKTIHQYFEGYLNAEKDALAQAFHANSKLQAAEEGFLRETLLSDWLKSVGVRKEKGDVRQADVQILGIDASGGAAMAKTQITFPKHIFTDYLSLLLIEGTWKIVNKIYISAENNNSSK